MEKSTKEPKRTIAYDYLFNYFGEDTFNEKMITGATIQLAIRVYKSGKEIKFIEEPQYEGAYLYQVFKVTFDRNKLFTVQRNLKVDNIFRLVFGWDLIEAEVIGYTLDYLDEGLSGEIKKGISEKFKNWSYSFPMEVSEREFSDFLIRNLDGFDISDNKSAQVPSTAFISI